MGDNLAVEIAQAAHSTVLRVLCSAMRSHEVLKYRCPIPRSDFVELLAIDDHVGIQRLLMAMFREHPALRDTEVFGEATNAYERVGLVLHEKKRKRGQTQGVILGADFDGGKGLPTNQPFCLSRQSRNELLLLAALGSTAQSDLRTTYSNKIYMTDASPTWGAVCQAPIEPAATAELWRHSEQRGFYTRLKDPAAAVLAELGVPAESDEMYAHDPYDSTHRSVPKIIPQQLKEGILFDCCELFRGVGNWTLVHKSRGLHCHDGFNIDGRRLRYDDLADKAVFAELMGLAARGVVRTSVAAFSASYPLRVVHQMASGSLAARAGIVESKPVAAQVRSLYEVGLADSFVGMLDSRVTIGAAAKGRSSSYALTRVLKGSVAYIIEGGLYPGLSHCYSEDNRADDPTRYRSVRGPSREKPAWFLALERGDPTLFDAVCASAKFEKNPARWLRFLLLLAGDIEPHPGPNARGPLDLQVGFAPAPAQRMDKCLQLFQDWCEDDLRIDWSVLTSDVHALVMALRAYGMFCFQTGMPRYHFVYAITAIQDRWPQSKPWMTPAWQIDRKWQIHEPGACRAVLPPSVIRAAACVAALWGWLNWAAMLLLGFSAMLHPSELLALFRKDLIFPSDVSFDSPSLYVRVRDPKTARFARRQHSRVDDREVIALLEQLNGLLQPSAKLYPESMSVFRRQWNAVLMRLGLPVKQSSHGATPGVLRGSGATYLYHQTEDLAWDGAGALAYANHFVTSRAGDVVFENQFTE
ncbi:Uncharacterized protein SCF082_LOCUS4736 [Durusdinium trenchii]|uniref:RNA-dependent RNA polymerase n=1 Tax=Durusdinium trenchii TaxID=1381693 RepID=A0ABP0I2U5_9DINO